MRRGKTIFAPKSSCTKQGGFTLVEVLVALFIFSILAASTLAVLTSTLRAKDQVAQKTENLQKRALLHMLLKDDFSNTIAVKKTDEFGQTMPIYFAGGSIGDERILVLSRTGLLNPGGIEQRSDLQAIDYRLDKGVLVRRSKPRFNGLDAVPMIEQPLLGGIEAIKTSFYDGENWSESWITATPPLGVSALPKLAAIELHFENGEDLRQLFYVGADQ